MKACDNRSGCFGHCLRGRRHDHPIDAQIPGQRFGLLRLVDVAERGKRIGDGDRLKGYLDGF